MTASVPTVSIGVPVYNGAGTIGPMLDSLLAQTFSDFEIVISDNASTDATAEICRKYGEADRRIRYFRQPENLGPEQNFRFVLEQACAPYFMWSACDDYRSPEFLEENVQFLQNHPDYVASTCPTLLTGGGPDRRVTFALDGDIEQRIGAFFDNCWTSHGIFYSVIRSDALKRCPFVGQSFYAFDWAVDLYLVGYGRIHRTRNGQMVYAMSGLSNQARPWRRFGGGMVSRLLPFYRVSRYALEVASATSLRFRLGLMARLLRLNLTAARVHAMRDLRSALQPVNGRA